MANSNLLIWPVDIDEGAIEFVRLLSGHPGFSRVIVHQAEQGTLHRKVLGEIRHHVSQTTYDVPQNLQGFSPTEEIHSSKIWDGHTFASFGSLTNLEPIITQSSAIAGKDRNVVGKPQNANATRVAEWSNQVVPSANPNIPPEAPPFEPAAPVRRRLLVESDSDEDEDSTESSSRSLTPQRSQQHSAAAPEGSSNPYQASEVSLIQFSDAGSTHSTDHIPSRNVDGSEHAQLAEQTAMRNQESLQNRIAQQDLPPFHSTMNQQGKNPGKSPNKQETKAQRKERIAKAMAEAHGDLPRAMPPVLPSIDRTSEAISKAKQALLKKKPAFAKDSAELAEAERKMRYAQGKKLVEQLTPLFGITRRFSGKLFFEAQLGQVLISQTHQLIDQPLHSPESWAAIFGPGNPNPSPSTFTRILTTNGADVDRALETKLPLGIGNTRTNVKIWNASPGPVSVTYEFSCHSRSSEDFLIAIDQTGQYQLHKGAITAGMVNIHIPSQVWDASFVLTGSLTWLDPPDILINSVKTFRDSLYVLPGRSKLIMVFRQPSDHEIEIRNLVVRRISLHQCNLPGHENMQLKVTEVKSLLFKRHPQDNNLWQAYEKSDDDHSKLMRDGRIHYEMSIVHTGINASLTQNESLEIGELTKTDPKSLLDHRTIQLMLELTVKMVSKLDYMGMSNIGTLYRIQQENEEQRRNLGNLLGTVAPPGSILPGGGTAVQQTQMRTNTSPSRETPPSLEMMPQGVRINTVAEIFVGPDGLKYRRGLGGAKIPVPDTQAADDDSILPEDSATQAGALGVERQPFVPPVIPPVTMPSAAAAAAVAAPPPVLAPSFPALIPSPSSHVVGGGPGGGEAHVAPSVGSTANPRIQFYNPPPSVSQRPPPETRDTGFW